MGNIAGDCIHKGNDPLGEWAVGTESGLAVFSGEFFFSLLALTHDS